MTIEQYNEAIKYRGIIELFVSSGQYIGGAEPLMDYYEFKGSERSCPSCVGRFLLERYSELKNYESIKNGTGYL